MLLNNIVQLCKERHVSIAKLEREIGLGNGTIGRWDRVSPTLECLQKVSEYFGIGLDDLLSSETQKV